LVTQFSTTLVHLSDRPLYSPVKISNLIPSLYGADRQEMRRFKPSAQFIICCAAPFVSDHGPKGSLVSCLGGSLYGENLFHGIHFLAKLALAGLALPGVKNSPPWFAYGPAAYLNSLAFASCIVSSINM
jgi:hypothetical protein